MTDVPVTPGPAVGATTPPQTTAAPAPPAAPPTTPAVSAPPSPPVTQPGEEFKWIDELGSAPEVPPVSPTPPPAPPYQYTPTPPPYQYSPPPPPVSMPYAPVPPAPAELINAFAKDPKGFVAQVAKEIAAQEMVPFVEALRDYVKTSHGERVESSIVGARERLREYAKNDPALANPAVAKEIDGTYKYFIANAKRGNPEAIATLNNPMSPFLVAQMAKARAGMIGANPTTVTPVVYTGGRLEGGSTVGPKPVTNLDPVTREWGQRWGLTDEQMKKNEEEAERYLNRR